MQYIACTYRKGDSRSYTFHNDGPPVAVGDEVKMPDKEGGWKRGYVTAIGVPKPTKFETKGILGIAPPKED